MITLLKDKKKVSEEKKTIKIRSVMCDLISIAAVACSWSVNKSVLWAILHWIFAGFYLPYWICKHSNLPYMIYENLVK
jgi:hypothetical protein